MRNANAAACGLMIAMLAVMAGHAGAIAGGTPVEASDSRFDAVAGVTLTEWVGINNVFGNATLIAADRVVMPRHLINRTFTNRRSIDGTPGAYTIRFRKKPDGTIGSADAPATFYHVKVRAWILPSGRKESDDVVIGILETPVTHIVPAVVDMKAKVTKNGRVFIASWGPVAVQTTVPVEKGTLLAGMVGVASWDKSRFKLSRPLPGASVTVVPNDSGSPILQVSGSLTRPIVKILGYVTTTSGGVSLPQHEGTRLFPRVRR